ncbi:helicase associated domain-containing protein [Kitasatospora sp. MAP5-34]|uniref:helicase associated domain-containing protein n=1 Tax=Kitasatospora sp. MAP5-34 TaxID=3035102 RepID=UPI0024763FA5|nr:helicase associated domain-containing protein [Kitasatospora sp. MAP5-34]
MHTDRQEQRELLAAIGIEEDQELVAARAVKAATPRRSQAERFQQGLEALAQYVRKVGHAKVPRTHREAVQLPDGVGTVEVAPGTWLNNVRARRAKLTPDQLAQLETLGVAW